MNTRLIHVRIVTPNKVILESEAESISSTNSTGKFDILGDHGKFVTLIENNPITIRVPGQPASTYSFPIAIVYVANNKVNIYTYPHS